MNFRRIKAVIKKQIKDTLKNKTVLATFLMFPVLAVAMCNLITIDDMPSNFFVTLFATMFVGIVPLTSIAAIISEEKEKNTLRVLMMANVKPVEYLLGIGIYVIGLCLVGACIFGITGKYEGTELIKFVSILLAGIVASGSIGAVIGVLSKNNMAATSMSVVAMMVFAFVPMLASFNDKVEGAARILYSQQMNYLLNDTLPKGGIGEVWAVIAVNILLASIAFVFAYRKKGLLN